VGPILDPNSLPIWYREKHGRVSPSRYEKRLTRGPLNGTHPLSYWKKGKPMENGGPFTSVGGGGGKVNMTRVFKTEGG